MNFINLPVAFRGRRLIQVPCGKITTSKLNAGYDPDLDATMAELPYKGRKFSLILMLPGKQTEFIAGGLSRIESRLNATLWNGLLRRMSPHNIDFKIPFFQHRSVIRNLKDAFMDLNMTSAFSKENADFSGVNGGRDLWMSEMSQLNDVRVEAGRKTRKEDQTQDVSSFRSAGRYKSFREARMQRKWRVSRQADEQHHHDHHEHSDHHHGDHHHPDHNHHHDESEEQDASSVRIYFERQFMYAIRHNPTGMLVYIGRYYQPEEAVQHNSHDSHQHHHGDHSDHH